MLAYFERGGLEKHRGGSPRSSHSSENAIQGLAFYVIVCCVAVVRGRCRFSKLNTLPFRNHHGSNLSGVQCFKQSLLRQCFVP